jgi:hypothetical protein
VGSGSTDWVRTRDQIITRALRIAGAVSMGDTPSSDAITEATEALNSIVKYLQTKGVRLWSQDWVNKYVSNTDQCSVDGTNYYCIRDGSGTDARSPETGSMWTMYWKEGGESGASIDSTVSYSAANMFYPASNVLDIDKMFIRDDDTDYELEKITVREYMAIEDKYPSSVPTKFCMEHGMTTRVHLYPVPDDYSYVIYYLATTSLEDFDSSGDLPDFPVRYIELLTWMLASRISSEKRLTVAERIYIDQQTDRIWRELITDDNENVDTECVRNAY